jgi:hypothetical protein
MPKEVETSSNKTAIRPLTVSFPETELIELRRRIKATRWPGTAGPARSSSS